MLKNDRHYFFQWSMAINSYRIPVAMAPLALLVAVGHTYGYSRGGLVVSVTILGEIASLVISNAMVRKERHTVSLKVTNIATILGTSAVAGAIMAHLGLLVVSTGAFLMGCLGALALGSYRGLLSRAIAPESIESAFTLDSVINEIDYLLAPILYVGSAALVGVSNALWLLPLFALLSLVSVLWLQARPSTSRTPHLIASETSTKAPTPPQAQGRLWIWISSAIEGVLEGLVVVTAPVLFASAHQGSLLAGPYLGILSLGSMIGGLVYGRLQRGRLGSFGLRSRAQLLLLGMAGTLAWLSLTHSTTSRFVIVGVFGLFIAPMNSARALAVTRTSPQKLHPLRFSILYGSYSVGYALAAVYFSVGLVGIGPRGLLSSTALAAVIAIALTTVVQSRVTASDSQQ